MKHSIAVPSSRKHLGLHQYAKKDDGQDSMPARTRQRGGMVWKVRKIEGRGLKCLLYAAFRRA